MATSSITRAGLYARISTRDKGQDVGNQLFQLREFAIKQGWTVVGEFVDQESGSTPDRPQFQAMFQAASRRKFDVLLFWSLDRLSREGVLETLQHLNRLTSYGVCWRSLTEQYFDSCGAFRDAVLAILAVIAKQERIRLSERTKAGLAIAKSKGQPLGRPRLKVQSTEIVRLRASGLSLRAIGKQLGISEGSVRKYASATA